MPLELLVEKLGHSPGYPPKSEVAVLTNPPYYVPWLIQRAYHQPLCLSAPEIQTGIASPIAGGAGQEPKKGVHHGLLVPGDRRDRCQSIGYTGKTVSLLGDGQCPPEQEAGAKDQRTEHGGEVRGLLSFRAERGIWAWNLRSG
jgi:hypothetical protein